MAKTRNLKVYYQYGYKDQKIPTIHLHGKWLTKDCGFDLDDKVVLVCEPGKLTITKEK